MSARSTLLVSQVHALETGTTVAPSTSTTTSSGLPRRVVQSFGAHTARILGSLPPAPAWAGKNGWSKCGAVFYHALLSSCLVDTIRKLG